MDKKRISARGIIIQDDCVYLMFRRKILDDGTVKEYYVIPGGGIEEGETKEEAIVRELKEELSIDVEIIEYLGTNEEEEAHFFNCKIIKGIPTLGGEELDRHNDKNYYEVKKMSIDSLENLNLLYKDIIMDVYQKTK